MAQTLELNESSTMRDIHDFCMRNGLFSVSQGMIEIPPPAILLDRVAETLRSPQEVHTYRKRYGEEDYLKAVQYMLLHVYNTKVETSNILATAGVTGGVISALSYLKKTIPSTKKIGLVEPFYTYHLKDLLIHFSNDRVVYVPCDSDYKLNLDTIEKSIKEHDIGVLMLCNPCNPSGLIVPKEKLDKLVAVCKANGATLILDEVYADFVLGADPSFYSPIQSAGGIPENVISVRGFTKCLGTQSWRIGYLLASPQLVTGIMGEHDPIYISLSWLQHSLAKYLTADVEDYKRHCGVIRDTMRANWKIMAPAFQERFGWQPIDPEGSMYGCFYHNNETDMKAVLDAVAAGVGVAPGVIFFRPGGNKNTRMIRIHCGISVDKAKQIAAKLRESKK